jgi:hypothetical protein
VTILWFWAGLVAAVFALATYNQAAEPGSKFGIVALLLGLCAWGYLEFALPTGVSAGDAFFARHPDVLRFRAANFVFLAGMICALGSLVGSLLRRVTSPARLGMFAFAVVFIGVQALAFYVASA